MCTRASQQMYTLSFTVFSVYLSVLKMSAANITPESSKKRVYK